MKEDRDVNVADAPPKDTSEIPEAYLKGTTYRVYRYMLKQGRPVGISDVQKALGLSSPSVSQYHIRKLLRLGLIREEQDGYVIDKMVLENVMRIRRISVPTQTAYVAFFGVTLFILLAFLKPVTISSLYFFAIVVNVAAVGISLYEARKTLRRL
ncbi:MAG: helix-turn-helix domain-containing protein [Nitrososphaerales archaeon]|nr:helix-turn-helix domain-containing protein [Nitrososphaerales archaeon]